MKHNTIKKKKLHRDCWDLDTAFLMWLKEHLPVYLKDAGRLVDLEYHKYDYKGHEYTQKALIEKMISLLHNLDAYTNFDQEYYYIISEILDIWKTVFHDMWW